MAAPTASGGDDIHAATHAQAWIDLDGERDAVLSTALLALAAFAAGVTGAWSPCGFSMVETLAGAAGREGAAGRRLIRTSSATFALGALLGGALTFTTLSGAGALIGAGGDTALAVAAVIALSAALADLLGVRVAPQIRRQVPERWRRTLPLPLAAALYGVLLGLGFTTFVLAFAVWALAGIAVALGDPPTGVAIGLAFGFGRALPVVAMAPRFDTLGIRLAERMALEPRLLRALRRTDAALLAAAALALLLGPTAASADARAVDGDAREPTALPAAGARPRAAAARSTVVARGATDPSVSGAALAWRLISGERAALRVPGTAPGQLDADQLALGGARLARLDGGTATVTDWTRGDAVVATLALGAGVSALAVSDRWLVWRAPRAGGGDELRGVALPAPGVAAPAPVTLVRSSPRGAISRPALDGARLAYAVSRQDGSRIVVRDLAAGRGRVVLRSRRTQLDQPALLGARVLYVQRRACDQRLRVMRLGAPTRTLLRIGSTARRDAGHEHNHTGQGSEPGRCPRGAPPRSATTLWTTALSPRAAFVTLLRASGTAPRATLVRIAR